MKKLFFSVCAASLLLFSACSKDDDKNVSEMSISEMNSMIIGTWRLDHGEWWNSYGDYGNYDDENERFTFNSDGTYLFLEDGYKETGYYWITSKKELIMRSRDEEDGEYYNDTLTIEKLTKTELVVLSDEGYDEYDYEWSKSRGYYKKIN